MDNETEFNKRWNEHVSEALFDMGLAHKLPFIAIRYKGVGNLYNGRYVYVREDGHVIKEDSEDILIQGDDTHFSKYLALVSRPNLMGQKGIFTDEPHQYHSSIPIGSGADDDVWAISRDEAFLERGAVLSVINLDAVELINQDQVPGLLIPKAYVTMGVVLDTTLTLETLIDNPLQYQRWVKTVYKKPFEEARELHLRELSSKIGRNLKVALDLGFTVRFTTVPTRKDFSAFGGLKDTGELVFIDDGNDPLPIVFNMISDILHTVEAAGLTIEDYLRSEAYKIFLQVFLQSHISDDDMKRNIENELYILGGYPDKDIFASVLAEKLLEARKQKEVDLKSIGRGPVKTELRDGDFPIGRKHKSRLIEKLQKDRNLPSLFAKLLETDLTPRIIDHQRVYNAGEVLDLLKDRYREYFIGDAPEKIASQIGLRKVRENVYDVVDENESDHLKNEQPLTLGNHPDPQNAWIGYSSEENAVSSPVQPPQLGKIGRGPKGAMSSSPLEKPIKASVNPTSFEWMSVIADGPNQREDKAIFMTRKLSNEVYRTLQDNGIINGEGDVTDSFNLIDGREFVSQARRDGDAGQRESILGLDAKFSLVEPLIVNILIEAVETQDFASALFVSDTDITRVRQIAETVYWTVNVMNEVGVEEEHVIQLRRADIEIDDQQSRHKIPYDIYSAPLSQVQSPANLTQSDYKGHAVLTLNSQGYLLHDIWNVYVRQKGAVEESWLQGFVVNKLTPLINTPINDENLHLHLSLREALQEKPELIEPIRIANLAPQTEAELAARIDHFIRLGRYRDIPLTPQKLAQIQKALSDHEGTNVPRITDYRVAQLLQKYGFDGAGYLPHELLIDPNEVTLNIGITGGIGEDTLALLQAASYYTGANFFYLLPGDIKIFGTGENTIFTGVPRFMFRNGQPFTFTTDEAIPLHYNVIFGELKPNGAFHASKTPLASHPDIDDYADEKDISMMILEKGGVQTPRWLSFIVNEHKSDRVNTLRNESEHVVNFDRKDPNLKNALLLHLRRFLTDGGITEGVAKPNIGRQGYHVVFFNQDNLPKQVDEIVQYIEGGEDFIIQERVRPPAIEVRLQSGDTYTVDYNARVFVSPDENGESKVYGKVIRYDREGRAVNLSQTADKWLLEQVGKELKLSPQEYQQLESAIDDAARKAHTAINDAMRESGLISDSESATDYMGVDIIVRREGDKFVAYVIEVNDHMSGAAWDLDDALRKTGHEFMSEAEVQERIGEASRGWIEAAIRRAQEYLHESQKIPEMISETALSDQVMVEEASSPVQSEKPGGIDMNPNNLDLQTQGGRFDLKIPLNSIDLQNIRIDGFTPVIINVAPLTNLPLLLGLVEEPEETENVRITPGRDPMDHRMEYDEELVS